MGTPAGWYDDGGGPIDEEHSRRSLSPWKVALIVGTVIVLLAAAFVVASKTARHWIAVDVPEHPETFHSEEYATGKRVVTDDGVSPCSEGQDWSECTDKMISEYEAQCPDRDLLAEASADLCSAYLTEIHRMQEVGEEGAKVGVVGNFGHLQSTPEYGTRTVSNNDHRPAVTHRATCYLEFLGECGAPAAADEAPESPSPAPSPSSPTPPPKGDTNIDVETIGSVPINPASDEEVAGAIHEAVIVVSEFWRLHFDELFPSDAPYEAPYVGGMYTAAQHPSICEGPTGAKNAFFCPKDDSLWFGADLLRQFYSVSDIDVYLIVAHEWGHAIRDRITDDTEAHELQADCLAAVALYGAAKDGTLTWEDRYTEDISYALTDVADATQWASSRDHGDALDRVGAFEQGRDGLEGCTSDF